MLKYSNISIVLSIIICLIGIKLLGFIDFSRFNPIMQIIICVVFILVLFFSPNIIYATILSIRKKQINHLKQNGKLIKAKFVEVTEKRRNVITREKNGWKDRLQYTIHCEGINPIDGTVMRFKSEECNFDLTELIQAELDVYIDIDKPNKYYVDIEQMAAEAQKQYDESVKLLLQQYKEYKRNKIKEFLDKYKD